MNKRLDEEKNKEIQTNLENKNKSTVTDATAKVSAEWTDDEIKLLVKAVKIIPNGTRNR